MIEILSRSMMGLVSVVRFRKVVDRLYDFGVSF